MAVREYIGARYVPKFVGTYSATTIYDALDVVDDGAGTSYIARKPVPAGTSLTDTEYWFVYGASSGAILNLQTRMAAAEVETAKVPGLVTDVGNLQTDVGGIDTRLTAAEVETAKVPGIKTDVDALLENVDFLKNKSVLIIGDSLSDEAVQAPNWVTRLRTMTAGLNTTITNISISGYGVGGLLPTIDSTPGNFDYIIVWLGVNDFNAQLALGAPNNNTTSTFYGCLYLLNQHLYAKWPGVPVYYCTPAYVTIHSDKPHYLPLNCYRAAIQDCCREYGWMIIDTTTGLPGYNIDDPTVRAQFSDGIHFQATYSQTLCNQILKQIKAGGKPCIGDFIDTMEWNTFSDPNLTGRIRVQIHTDGSADLDVYFTNIPASLQGGQHVISTDVPAIIALARPLICIQNDSICPMYLYSNSLYFTFPAGASSLTGITRGLRAYNFPYEHVNY